MYFSLLALINRSGLTHTSQIIHATVEGARGVVPGVFTMPECRVFHAGRNELVFRTLTLVTHVRGAEGIKMCALS